MHYGSSWTPFSEGRSYSRYGRDSSFNFSTDLSLTSRNPTIQRVLNSDYGLGERSRSPLRDYTSSVSHRNYSVDNSPPIRRRDPTPSRILSDRSPLLNDDLNYSPKSRSYFDFSSTATSIFTPYISPIKHIKKPQRTDYSDYLRPVLTARPMLKSGYIPRCRADRDDESTPIVRERKLIKFREMSNDILANRMNRRISWDLSDEMNSPIDEMKQDIEKSIADHRDRDSSVHRRDSKDISFTPPSSPIPSCSPRPSVSRRNSGDQSVERLLYVKRKSSRGIYADSLADNVDTHNLATDDLCMNSYSKAPIPPPRKKSLENIQKVKKNRKSSVEILLSDEKCSNFNKIANEIRRSRDVDTSKTATEETSQASGASTADVRLHSNVNELSSIEESIEPLNERGRRRRRREIVPPPEESVCETRRCRSRFRSVEQNDEHNTANTNLNTGCSVADDTAHPVSQMHRKSVKYKIQDSFQSSSNKKRNTESSVSTNSKIGDSGTTPKVFSTDSKNISSEVTTSGKIFSDFSEITSKENSKPILKQKQICPKSDTIEGVKNLKDTKVEAQVFQNTNIKKCKSIPNSNIKDKNVLGEHNEEEFESICGIEIKEKSKFIPHENREEPKVYLKKEKDKIVPTISSKEIIKIIPDKYKSEDSKITLDEKEAKVKFNKEIKSVSNKKEEPKVTIKREESETIFNKKEPKIISGKKEEPEIFSDNKKETERVSSKNKELETVSIKKEKNEIILDENQNERNTISEKKVVSAIHAKDKKENNILNKNKKEIKISSNVDLREDKITSNMDVKVEIKITPKNYQKEEAKFVTNKDEKEETKIVPKREGEPKVQPNKSKGEKDKILPSRDKQAESKIVPNKDKNEETIIPNKRREIKTVSNREEEAKLVLDKHKKQGAKLVLEKDKEEEADKDKKKAIPVLNKEKKEEAKPVLDMNKKEEAKLVIGKDKKEESKLALNKDNKEEPKLILKEKKEEAKLVFDKDKNEEAKLVLNKKEEAKLVLHKDEEAKLVLNKKEEAKLVLNKKEEAELVLNKKEEAKLVLNKDKKEETKLILDKDKKEDAKLAVDKYKKVEAKIFLHENKKEEVKIAPKQEENKIAPAKDEKETTVLYKQKKEETKILNKNKKSESQGISNEDIKKESKTAPTKDKETESILTKIGKTNNLNKKEDTHSKIMKDDIVNFQNKAGKESTENYDENCFSTLPLKSSDKSTLPTHQIRVNKFKIDPQACEKTNQPLTMVENTSENFSDIKIKKVEFNQNHNLKLDVKGNKSSDKNLGIKINALQIDTLETATVKTDKISEADCSTLSSDERNGASSDITGINKSTITNKLDLENDKKLLISKVSMNSQHVFEAKKSDLQTVEDISNALKEGKSEISTKTSISPTSKSNLTTDHKQITENLKDNDMFTKKDVINKTNLIPKVNKNLTSATVRRPTEDLPMHPISPTSDKYAKNKINASSNDPALSANIASQDENRIDIVNKTLQASVPKQKDIEEIVVICKLPPPKKTETITPVAIIPLKQNIVDVKNSTIKKAAVPETIAVIKRPATEEKIIIPSKQSIINTETKTCDNQTHKNIKIAELDVKVSHTIVLKPKVVESQSKITTIKDDKQLKVHEKLKHIPDVIKSTVRTEISSEEVSDVVKSTLNKIELKEKQPIPNINRNNTDSSNMENMCNSTVNSSEICKMKQQYEVQETSVSKAKQTVSKDLPNKNLKGSKPLDGLLEENMQQSNVKPDLIQVTEKVHDKNNVSAKSFTEKAVNEKTGFKIKQNLLVKNTSSTCDQNIPVKGLEEKSINYNNISATKEEIKNTLPKSILESEKTPDISDKSLRVKNVLYKELNTELETKIDKNNIDIKVNKVSENVKNIIDVSQRSKSVKPEVSDSSNLISAVLTENAFSIKNQTNEMGKKEIKIAVDQIQKLEKPLVADTKKRVAYKKSMTSPDVGILLPSKNSDIKENSQSLCKDQINRKLDYASQSADSAPSKLQDEKMLVKNKFGTKTSLNDVSSDAKNEEITPIGLNTTQNVCQTSVIPGHEKMTINLDKSEAKQNAFSTVTKVTATEKNISNDSSIDARKLLEKFNEKDSNGVVDNLCLTKESKTVEVRSPVSKESSQTKPETLNASSQINNEKSTSDPTSRKNVISSYKITKDTDNDVISTNISKVSDTPEPAKTNEKSNISRKRPGSVIKKETTASLNKAESLSPVTKETPKHLSANVSDERIKPIDQCLTSDKDEDHNKLKQVITVPQKLASNENKLTSNQTSSSNNRNISKRPPVPKAPGRLGLFLRPKEPPQTIIESSSSESESESETESESTTDDESPKVQNTCSNIINGKSPESDEKGRSRSETSHGSLYSTRSNSTTYTTFSTSSFDDEPIISPIKPKEKVKHLKFRKYEIDDFVFLKLLGKGSFGKVLLAELKDSEMYFAIKCLKKDVVLEDDDVESTMIERRVLALGTQHPYMCKLYCTFQTKSYLFFVMEYLNGGDLMFHIQESRRFEEHRAMFYGAEIVSALKFLHKRGIVYRDIKLDNVMLDVTGHIRIVDFGMCQCRIYREECMPSNFCGTPTYIAPEIVLGQKYNESVDWWSFGVLLYEMLTGRSPFQGTDEDELFWSICNEEPHYPRFLSREAMHMLGLILVKAPSKRLGMSTCPAGEIKDHAFFSSIDWDKIEKKEVPPPFKPNVSGPSDTSNFDSSFTMDSATLSPVESEVLQSMDQKQFHGFSYTNPHITG